MTNVNDARFKAACEEYIREALADGLNREQVLGKLKEMTKIAVGESIAGLLLFGGLFHAPPSACYRDRPGLKGTNAKVT